MAKNRKTLDLIFGRAGARGGPPILCAGALGPPRTSGAGAVQVVAAEFKVEAAAREPELAGGARDVAVMLAERLGDHAALQFGHRVGEREPLRERLVGGVGGGR